MEEISAFEEFFREAMRPELEEIAANYPEVRSISIDYRKLEQFNPELADELLLHPDDIIKAAKAAIENLGIPVASGKHLSAHCRFNKLPESRNTMVQDLGADHLERLIKVEGIISLAAEIKPVVKTASWECMHCGETTRTYPDKNLLKTPDFCKCGRRDFKHMEKDDVFINMQSAQMQDLVEKLRGNAPTTHITLWMEDDLVNTVTPGEKFAVTGVLRKRPVRKDGKVSAVYEKLLEVVHLDRLDKEFEALEISEDEKRELIELSKRPDLFELITRSIAPSIYGHDEVKLAIALQLFGGNFNKVLPDGKKIRGETHILLIGDPGCLIFDERVVLGNGAIVQLGSMGEGHLQKINVPLLTGQGHNVDRAKVFHTYRQQPILEIITESGKCIKGTYNHPLLTVDKMERKWKRLDELVLGDRLACVPWIPCTIKSDLPLDWKKTSRKYGPKFKGKLPSRLNPSLAGLLGYIQGDGWVTRTLAAMDVIPDEADLIPKLVKIITSNFGIRPKIMVRHAAGKKPMNIVIISSTDIAANLSFLKEKRVPAPILQSRNQVAAQYLAWLFEADGTVFSKGRGRRAVQLRTSKARVEFLRDVQILLLRFGVHSRILNNETLAIRRANSILKFSKHIGFCSNKKKTRLVQLVKDTSNLHHRLGKQLSEKIVSIRKAGVADVFDVEIPLSHRFIANGIISHNTSKTTMLLYVKNLAPKCIYVSGKGTSGVGLTASAEKAEFGEGWVLKAGAMVLASGGQVNIDEVDKMDENDRVAMHEALESGQISIAKAGIVTTFKARTAVLAAANPKLGRFNPNEPPASQFDLGPTLQSRFDLIFPIKDVLDEIRDRKMAEHIIKGHKYASDSSVAPDEAIVPPIPIDLLRKYIAYSRKNFAPTLSSEASEKIKEFYLMLRRLGEKQNNYPVTARQIEGLIRLSEASAKARLGGVVELQDAERAINLTEFVLQTVFMDRETGRIDSDIINIGQAKSRTDRARTILSIIEEKEKDVDMVSVEDVVKEAEKAGIDEPTVRRIVEDLHRQTEIYRPKSGFVRTSKSKRQ
ncbi:MAG: LAGLIDADG family homing endonuclease [Candidatus Micrarchaeota archaeon]